MSLTDSPDWLFRPEEKALKMLFPTVDEPIHNSFDEFFDGDFYTSGDASNDKESLPNDDFLVFDHIQNTFPNKQLDVSEPTTQPWRKGLWCLNSKPTSELVVGKSRKMDVLTQKFIAPARLLSNDNTTVESPIVLPRTRTKTIPTSPKPVIRGNDHFSRVAMREQTLSPSPMYAQLCSDSKMGQNETWQQELQDFHLQMPDNGMYLTSPHSRKLNHHDLTLRQTNARVIAHNANASHAPQSPAKYHYPFNHVSRPPNGYQDAEQLMLQVPEQADISRVKVEAIQQSGQLAIGAEQYAAPVWTTESLHSSDSSSQSYNSHFSNESYPRMASGYAVQVWNSEQGTTTTFSPHNSTRHIAAPVPQRIPHQILYQQEQHSGGLGIHYANPDEIGRAIPYEPTAAHRYQHRTVTPPLPTHVADYPPLPPYPIDTTTDISPFTTPHRRRQTSHSRSPSPSISPTHRPTRRSIGQRSPTRDYTQTRRKSIHKAGPIKETTSQDAHRRTRSTSRPPRTPKTPRTPTSAGFSQIGFVNFTPKDSAKLMTDVAPSGSSKTRARREQEARDKRKKLNEAALQAVRNAGGDVTALERAIFV